MKVLYIAATAAMVHMIRYKEPYKSTYDRTQDSFRLEFAVVPCAVLALLTNLVRGFGLVEVRAVRPSVTYYGSIRRPSHSLNHKPTVNPRRHLSASIRIHRPSHSPVPLETTTDHE